MRPRVLFVNRSYWPDTEATGQLLTQLCEDLAADFDVHVITGQPNHVQEGAETGFAAVGLQVYRGVTIHRVRHSQFPKRSMAGKLCNLATFAWSAWRYAAKVPQPDVVVTETDPFFLAWLGARWQRRWAAKYVAYLQDIYPDVAVAVGKTRNHWGIRRLRDSLFRAYRGAERVVVLSEDMRQLCIRYGVKSDRLRIVPNWADVEAVRPSGASNPFRAQLLGEQGNFLVMYSGNLGLAHWMQPVVDAADVLRDSTAIRFAIVGEGVRKAEMQREVARRGLTNVQFLPYQPRERLTESLGAADVHLVSVLPDAVACLMPSKVYGVLAAGRPMAVIAPAACELTQIVETERVGVVCPTELAEGAGRRLAEQLLGLAADPARRQSMGERARALAEAKYARHVCTAAFASVLRELVPQQLPVARGAAG